MLVLVFKRDQSYRSFYLQINWLNRRWICGGPIENIIIHVGLYKRIKEIEEAFLIDEVSYFFGSSTSKLAYILPRSINQVVNYIL